MEKTQRSYVKMANRSYVKGIEIDVKRSCSHVKVVVDGDDDAKVVAVAGFASDDGRVLRTYERLGDQVDLAVHLGHGFEYR